MVHWSYLALPSAFVTLLACGNHSGGNNGPDAAGGNVGCGLVTCASSGATCGPIGDGCGGTIDCGTCNDPDTCGGGGTLFICGSGGGGSSSCVPRSCADVGANCGVVADGCGGVTASLLVPGNN